MPPDKINTPLSIVLPKGLNPGLIKPLDPAEICRNYRGKRNMSKCTTNMVMNKIQTMENSTNQPANVLQQIH